jgi:hypothetical protein
MPDRKQLFGCEKKARKYVECEQENNLEYLYWNCPVTFVPKSVREFIKVYKYYKDFPSATMPKFEDCSPKFIRAVNYLESKKNEYLSKKDK